MKRILTICLILIAGVARAGDETQVLIDAAHVKSTVVLSLDGQNVRYVADNGSPKGSVGTGTTLVASSGITFLFHDYHPLKLIISVTEKKEDEPVTKGGSEFFEAVLGNVKLLPGLGAGVAGDKGDLTSDICSNEYNTCEVKALAEATAAERTNRLQQCKQDLADCTTCSELKEKVASAAQAIDRLSKVTISDDERTEWSSKAVGIDGIKEVRGLVRDKIKLINGDLERLRKARELLADLASTKPKTTVRGVAPSEKFPDKCEWGRRAESSIALLANAAGEVIMTRQQLADNLTALDKALEKYGDTKNWSTTDPKDYILLEADSDVDKKDVITFKFTPVALNASGVVVPNDSAAITREAHLRGYRRLVPEFGVAAVWNDLRYPKYTVKEEAGTKTVASNGFESSNVNAAATMNLLCNCFGGRFVYPGLQLGVSKAKDYPGILAGVAFRFVGAKRFAVSVGQMITWYKDLNKLQVGSTVGSENDIKADLSLKKSPTTLYIAAQYNF